MGGAPVIETVRPGVQFAPDAAASFRRAEASWGRKIRCSSTYRNYGLQLSMWEAWEAWTAGRGPKPNHSRALHPDESVHCRGEALDTPDWTVAGFIAHMADHGWIRTAAWDPTEQHHFEYQWWRDNHRHEPAPTGAETQPKEWDEMATKEEIAAVVREAVYQNTPRRYPLVPFPDGGIFLHSPDFANRVRVASPYHVSLIQRAMENNADDVMLPGEIDIVRAYVLAVDPPAGLTVDAEALATRLGEILPEKLEQVDATQIGAEVSAAIRDNTQQIAVAVNDEEDRRARERLGASRG